MDEIKKKLATIIRSVKTSIEIEKGFGIDSIIVSKPNKANLSLLNSLHEDKKVETVTLARPFDQQTFTSEKERRTKLLEELHQEVLTCHK